MQRITVVNPRLFYFQHACLPRVGSTVRTNAVNSRFFIFNSFKNKSRSTFESFHHNIPILVFEGSIPGSIPVALFLEVINDLGPHAVGIFFYFQH